MLKGSLNRTLTDREWQIAAAVVEGRDEYITLAKQIGISENTFKRHLTNIYDKLGIDNRFHLAIFWKDLEIAKLRRRIAELEGKHGNGRDAGRVGTLPAHPVVEPWMGDW